MYDNFDSYDFYKRLTRNPEIGNTPVQVLPNIWRLGELEIPNLARMFVIKCYSTLHAKYHCYSFYRFGSIKGKPTGGVKLPKNYPHPPPPRFRLSMHRKNLENPSCQYSSWRRCTKISLKRRRQRKVYVIGLVKHVTWCIILKCKN